jgi:hypothetical protein
MPSLGGRTLNEYNDMSYLTGPETLAICMMRGPPMNDNYPILFRAKYKDDVSNATKLNKSCADDDIVVV